MYVYKLIDVSTYIHMGGMKTDHKFWAIGSSGDGAFPCIKCVGGTVGSSPPAA